MRHLYHIDIDFSFVSGCAIILPLSCLRFQIMYMEILITYDFSFVSVYHPKLPLSNGSHWSRNVGFG